MKTDSLLTGQRQRVIVYALLLLITLPMLTKTFTSDYGTHLAIGRQIVQALSIPDKEFLNYPSLGMENPNGEWGFEALLWIVFSLGGQYGHYTVSFLCWAVVFGIFLLLHRATVLRGANPYIAVAAIFAFSGFLRIRIQPRPEIFTYLFTAATIYLFSEYYFGARKKLIYAFPVMVLVWANMHPTYLMAFGLACAFAGERFLHALFKGELDVRFAKEKLLIPAILTILAGLLCGINPHGWDALLVPLNLISRSNSATGGGGSNPVLMSISELTPVRETGFLIYYKAAAWFAVATIFMGLVGRRLYLLDVVLFGIAFKYSWDSARAVSMMGLFLSPGASLQITGFLEAVGRWVAPASPLKPKNLKAKDKPSPPSASKAAPVAEPAPADTRRSLGRSAAMGVIAACLLGFGVLTLSFSFSQLEYGVGLTEHKFSLKAGQFLRQLPIKGNMFNFFDIGGFLDWQLYPGKLTFIDGRTYNSKIFMDHQMGTGSLPGWDAMFNEHGITYVVLKTMDSSGMVLPIISTLANAPEWQLIFADGLFVVFARDIPENHDLIRKYALPKNTTLPNQIIQEAYHYMYLGISPVVAYMTISDMYQLVGDRQGAIAALRKGAGEVGGEEANMLNGRLLQIQGGGAFR
ncbi:MAG TPA: hypothetical protein VGK27_09420 [Candidatus Deferrimicrobiaceae bacterium]|jgi:hypothetical protein